MDINTVIATESVKTIFSMLREKEKNQDTAKTRRQEEEEIRESLGKHLKETLNWSQRIQFFGMSVAEQVDTSTVRLRIDTIPRKFRGEHNNSEKIEDTSLLSYPGHILLLGDPGSGKTTTLKRMAFNILTEPPQSSMDRANYPIAIRLRSLSIGATISEAIANALGIIYERKWVKNKKKIEINQQGRKEVIEEKVYELSVCGERLSDVIPEIIDSTSAILLLDGLDEVPVGKRVEIEKEIARLAQGLSHGKVVMSCRSGDYTRQIDGFDVLEICPIDEDQIFQIASKWLDNPVEFTEALFKFPYGDLAGRPLFLCQLIVYYRNTGYFPDQPATVYRKIARMLLEEWDSQRGIKRGSRYAQFNPDRKLDFLAALSYQLTYQLQASRFTKTDLIHIYQEVRESFDLPPGEAERVAEELETHTGIIVESGPEFYEFSHLSLQEYLCAEYLVREPFAGYLVHYLGRYPGPIAVAVSLSSNPSNWLAGLILSKKTFYRFTKETVSSFFSRMTQEKPYFSFSAHLGFALLRLLFESKLGAEPLVVKFLRLNSPARRSVSVALTWYHIDYEASDQSRFKIEMEDGFVSSYDFYIPRAGLVSRYVIDLLVKDKSLVLEGAASAQGARGSFECTTSGNTSAGFGESHGNK